MSYRYKYINTKPFTICKICSKQNVEPKIEVYVQDRKIFQDFPSFLSAVDYCTENSRFPATIYHKYYCNTPTCHNIETKVKYYFDGFFFVRK